MTGGVPSGSKMGDGAQVGLGAVRAGSEGWEQPAKSTRTRTGIATGHRADTLATSKTSALNRDSPGTGNPGTFAGAQSAPRWPVAMALCSRLRGRIGAGVLGFQFQVAGPVVSVLVQPGALPQWIAVENPSSVHALPGGSTSPRNFAGFSVGLGRAVPRRPPWLACRRGNRGSWDGAGGRLGRGR